MLNLRNTLFYKFAFIVFLIIAAFEAALLFSLMSSFNSKLKEKLSLISTEIIEEKLNTANLIKIQHKYKIYPLYVNIFTPPKHKEGFHKEKLLDFSEPLISYSIIKNGKEIEISTLLSTNRDKLEIVKTISILISFVIYLIVLIIGYQFIDRIVQEIDNNFKRLKAFNSNISHELKTPLTIMKGEIEVALMNNECKPEMLKSILQEVNYLNDITEKLLFLTKDRKNIKFNKVDLEEIIIEIFEKFSQEREIELDIGEDIYEVQGEKTLLNIMISNLVRNSIKYGASKIIISLRKVKNYVILSIKDNGIGIPKEKLPFIFDEFYRVDESHNKKIKGFGLGLSIVKNIAKLHNIKIEVKSEEEKGTEFILKFSNKTLS